MKKEQEQNKKDVVLDEQVAIKAYLDSLLSEISTSVAEEASVAEPVTQVDTVSAVAEPPAPPEKTEIPAWATESFQVLLFDVMGLTLAIPLTHLSGIENWPSELTSLPGKPDWFMGLHPYRDKNAVVVDITQIVIPEDRQNFDPEEARSQFNSVVFIGEGVYGLACDQVAEVITLKSEMVSWRTIRGQRPWLAGMVRDKMCALLDIEEFIRMLKDE